MPATTATELLAALDAAWDARCEALAAYYAVYDKRGTGKKLFAFIAANEAERAFMSARDAYFECINAA